jgi:pimeloyl-ACP methyl ester carboxylesterase
MPLHCHVMSALTGRTKAWRSSGELAELGGRRIFVREREGSGPPLLFLHGYPSSSYDWRAVLELLPGRRVVCFDFLGFGLSEKPRDHVYSLNGQADLVELVAQRFVRGSPVVVAHDMGTSVVTELLARDLEGRLAMRPEGVLLLNGSMVLERARLTLSQKLLKSPVGALMARFSNERLFRAQFARIFSRKHPLLREDADDAWSLLAHDGGHRILDRLTYYLHERVRFAPRWHGALRDWQGRLDLAWAMRDPVCVPAVLGAVRELRPRAPVTRWDALGHYPQIEDPVAVAEVIRRFADQAP